MTPVSAPHRAPSSQQRVEQRLLVEPAAPRVVLRAPVGLVRGAVVTALAVTATVATVSYGSWCVQTGGGTGGWDSYCQHTGRDLQLLLAAGRPDPGQTGTSTRSADPSEGPAEVVVLPSPAPSPTTPPAPGHWDVIDLSGASLTPASTAAPVPAVTGGEVQ